jgi:hypothetical protein
MIPAGGWGADESEGIERGPSGDCRKLARHQGFRWAAKGQNCDFTALCDALEGSKLYF